MARAVGVLALLRGTEERALALSSVRAGLAIRQACHGLCVCVCVRGQVVSPLRFFFLQFTPLGSPEGNGAGMALLLFFLVPAARMMPSRFATTYVILL